jgi:hypothetical protein
LGSSGSPSAWVTWKPRDDKATLDSEFIKALNICIKGRGQDVRASIEHKGHYGFLGFNPQFILHLDIQFSNEERAIIRTRALQDYVFDLSPGFLAGSESGHSPEALTAFAIGGFWLFAAGIFVIFLAAIVPAFGTLALLMLSGGPVLFWYAFVAKRRAEGGALKQVTVGYLVENPALAVRALNPGQASTLDENIRRQLANLKHFLTATHGLAAPRDFEF